MEWASQTQKEWYNWSRLASFPSHFSFTFFYSMCLIIPDQLGTDCKHRSDKILMVRMLILACCCPWSVNAIYYYFSSKCSHLIYQLQRNFWPCMWHRDCARWRKWNGDGKQIHCQVGCSFMTNFFHDNLYPTVMSSNFIQSLCLQQMRWSLDQYCNHEPQSSEKAGKGDVKGIDIRGDMEIGWVASIHFRHEELCELIGSNISMPIFTDGIIG